MQLDLLAFRPPAAPVRPVSATHLLWCAAGCPAIPGEAHEAGALCWWCGHEAPEGRVWPRESLPGTFPFPLAAAVARSPWLCLPCAWTLCDSIALPVAIGTARIRTRAERGGRLNVSVRGLPAAKWLVLQLEDGTVGLWTPAVRASAEEPWIEAVDELRGAPRDVGTCAFIESVPYDALAPEATEKFRSYHHCATEQRWWPCTDSDRAAIRAWLCDPPAPPWVAVIGDGKKHAAIEAQRLDAVTTAGLCRVYFRASPHTPVDYLPAELSRQIAAAEALVLAGANDEEIMSGQYSARGMPMLQAMRAHEPHIAPIRGGPTLALVLYLKRPRYELTSLATPTPEAP